MPRHVAFYQWRDTIGEHFRGLSKPQVCVLALWAWGMVCTRCCGLTTVAVFLAMFFDCPGNTMRQRLREFYQEADAKAGQKRQALDVKDCFAPLLGWVVEGWPTRQLPIALDASNLGDQFVVLAISVVYRGCSVPVAWRILPAALSTPWRDEWLTLLQQFKGLVPQDWTVLALTDRGLWAPWLFAAIVALGWHPFMPRWPGAIPASSGLCGEGRGVLARPGHGVFDPRPAVAVYLDGLVGARAQRAVANPDRPAPRGRRGRLVRPARLGRTGVQGHKTRGLAVAAHADG